ncbi:hypothetical protein [Lederbergia citrisecunda]|nr:hypothetical protein [Lederbergia citrisecunda]
MKTTVVEKPIVDMSIFPTNSLVPILAHAKLLVDKLFNCTA